MMENFSGWLEGQLRAENLKSQWTDFRLSTPWATRCCAITRIDPNILGDVQKNKCVIEGGHGGCGKIFREFFWVGFFFCVKFRIDGFGGYFGNGNLLEFLEVIHSASDDPFVDAG